MNAPVAAGGTRSGSPSVTWETRFSSRSVRPYSVSTGPCPARCTSTRSCRYQKVIRPWLPWTITYGSEAFSAQSVAATVTRVPAEVRTRTPEVSSDSMAWACSSSVSMCSTSSARVEPDSASAVATAWARGW